MPAVVSPAIVVSSTYPWTVSIPGTRFRYVRTGSMAIQNRRTEKDLPMSTPVTIILEGNNLPCTLCLHLRKRRSFAGCEDLQNPIWVDAFEGFRQIKGKNCAR
jgi:hypothetical protein